jgi:hypothetical protein
VVKSAGSVTDALVAKVLDAVAMRLTATGIPGIALRERRHLDPFVKDEIERRSGRRPVSRTLRSPDFPGLGAVDVVLERPKALIELKWAYGAPAKIFESVWDATKLALLGAEHGYEALYVVCGASSAEWAASESSALFRQGEVDALGLWQQLLAPPRGPNYGKTVGEDLLIGARGNRPRRAHARLAVRTVADHPVAGDYALRTIGVTGVGSLTPWPEIFGSDERAAAPTQLESVELPSRVTQAWIERTAPRLTPAAIAPFLRALRERGWGDSELTTRVRPHLPGTS